MTKRLLFLLIALAPLSAARADVKLHELFTDNMVLQAGRENLVWGTADPGEAVTVAVVELPGNPNDEGKAIMMHPVTAGQDGRWSVKLPRQSTTAEGRPGLQIIARGKNQISVKNVLVGEVWVCSGQSNMQWAVFQSHDPEGVKKGAKDPGLRLYSVPRTTSLTPLRNVPHHKDPRYNFTRWVECDAKTVEYFSAVAYHFGKHLRQTRKVPIGLIHTSWGGTPAESWTSSESLDAVPELRYYHENLSKSIKNFDADKAREQYKQALAKWEKDAAEAKTAGKPAPRRPQPPAQPGTGPHTPSSLYNAMIAPLIPYGIAGAIWYQGESNAYPTATMSAAERANEYRTLFPTMIKDWRKNWGQGDFPFLFVQLAPFEAGPQAAWAELREAQLLTLSLPKTGMAVITDVGDAKDIHPAKKGPVGERLALAAQAIAYGENIEYSGPVYESMTVEGNRAVLKFKHADGGLVAAGGGKLTGFTVAGDDHKFVEAAAEITGQDTITVSAPGVDKPVAVRYGWANYPKVNLANKAGLPATPFRTDN